MAQQIFDIRKAIKWSAITVVGLIAFFMLMSMFRTVELGYTDVYQNKATGNTVVYHGPDWYISPIFVGVERTYKDDTTVAFTANPEDKDKFSSVSTPIDIRFADTYEAKLPLTARFVLPSDDEHMLMVDKSFRSYKNLVNSLYDKTMIDVTTNTAQQFTAEEVTQGGLNALKSAISDQVNKGVYVTERKRVRVEQTLKSKVGVGGDKSRGTLNEQEVTVWKAVPKLDRNGKIMRNENPFEKYGIQVLQVNLADPTPEALLEKLLIAKKTSVAKKILSVQEQDNAKEDIKTAKLQGQAEREKAEQKRLIIADAEIIERKKEVQVAKLRAQREIVDREKLASLAIIDKKKELQIAKDNEGIQQANERATKFQAQAKLHIGLAEAQIKKAKYEAVVQPILELEVTRVTQLAKYQALKNGKGLVQMPEKVIINNGGGAGVGENHSTTLEDLANIKLMEGL